jgi:hypothetical protein
MTKRETWVDDYAGVNCDDDIESTTTAALTEARVIVSSPFVNIVTMQVCAMADASDEEILEVCNRENRSGTSNGWSEVLRVAEPESMFKDENKLPVTCSDNPDRKHFLVLC